MIATDCDAIVTGLYEYWVCYKPAFPDKTSFIPFPIVTSEKEINCDMQDATVKVFIGISKNRSEYKGTDIMLRAAKHIKEKHPERMELYVVEGVPFNEYVMLMNSSDIIMDQLYSYTPAMNALQAMSQGLICMGGGEEENYEILNEKELRPIINVQPTYESVCKQLEAPAELDETLKKIRDIQFEISKTKLIFHTICFWHTKHKHLIVNSCHFSSSFWHADCDYE